ncbi:MAG TPA: DUF2865 domain-containing protein [Methyloceanibacter sp.]|nr:DUF2865 domain-containing protein [Methyloceanibacter sp.]
MSVRRDLWRAVASLPAGPPWLGVFALACAGIVAGADPSPAQGVSEQQMRCMQLQQDLAAAQGGGGANRADIANIEKQIAQADRVFQGTQAAMEDAGCFDSFFIFGRGLVRSPKCINMNARVEDARRQLTQLQQQRQVLMGGGGNRRRQAELRDALARSGCGGQVRPARRGFFDFFGGGREEEEEPLPQTPVYRSIDPGGRYRTVCVRLCDGFFYPIHYATYGSMVGPDAEACQSSCAAPAELYVYRNPGQEIEQAVSLSGSAYMDLPVALRYRKEYVKGCSCKQAEYNPTDIMAANKQAGIDTGPMPPARAPVSAASDQTAAPVEITGATPPADQAAPPPTDQAAPPPVDAVAPPPAPPPSTSAAVEQAPPAPKPPTSPQKQKPPAPPKPAAAPPPPSDSAEAVRPAPAAPKPSRTPSSPKASPFGQY